MDDCIPPARFVELFLMSLAAFKSISEELRDEHQQVHYVCGAVQTLKGKIFKLNIFVCSNPLPEGI